MPTGLHQLFETIVDSGIEKESVESAQQRAKFSVETLDGRGVFKIVDVEGMGNERSGHEETEKGTQGTGVKSENKVEVQKINGECLEICRIVQVMNNRRPETVYYYPPTCVCMCTFL
jgi:hypothetical protein